MAKLKNYLLTAAVVALTFTSLPAFSVTQDDSGGIVRRKGTIVPTALSTVYFGFDQYELTEADKKKLDKLVAHFKEHDIKEVVVNGYTDPIGSKTDNEELSMKRAQAVYDYLNDHMELINSEVKVHGRGEKKQVKSCEGMSKAEKVKCLEPNRRVVVSVKSDEEMKMHRTTHKTESSAINN